REMSPHPKAASLRRDCVAALRFVVLARTSNRAELLSTSLLRRRGDSNRKLGVVLAHCATDSEIQPHPGSLAHGAGRFIRPAVAGSKIISTISLVAGCHGFLRGCGGLRQSSSVVSASVCTDPRGVCRGRVRLCRIENSFACHHAHIVDCGREFLCDPCRIVCSTVLSIIGGATPTRRSGIEQSDSAKCVDRGRGHGRSDYLLLCGAEGLAFSGERRNLQRQSGRQRPGNPQS